MPGGTLVAPVARSAAREGLRLVFDLFKLRIGISIAVTALAGVAVTPGETSALQVAVVGLAVLIASAAAGAFNQYAESDLDSRMQRTRGRAFVTGRLKRHAGWLALIVALLAGAVGMDAWLVNAVSAMHVFLGAFFYAVVYTLWLKRRTWLNIVVGGLAGSFAVLAGAAAVAPGVPGPLPLAFAFMLFLWTPPHFWSLAIANREDYLAAGVPMLPVVVGNARAARTVCSGAVLLAAASLLPLAFGMGYVYAAGAVIGGLFFVRESVRLVSDQSRKQAIHTFLASLVQLTLVLAAAIADRLL